MGIIQSSLTSWEGGGMNLWFADKASKTDPFWALLRQADQLADQTRLVPLLRRPQNTQDTKAGVAQ